ncbi:transposase [Streptomyces sp. NPDC093707]|uniref:IS110 family transposase n=1 Tax=Streptomyces sp. NPDC093707 TaxID=3154984 RepID=UPI00344E759F
MLESCGLDCWLVNARDVKNVPGRPKTDKLDAVWLAKLTERGMLRASFVPPKPIRNLRDLTRLSTVFTRERTRTRQRVEKLLVVCRVWLIGWRRRWWPGRWRRGPSPYSIRIPMAIVRSVPRSMRWPPAGNAAGRRTG